MTVHPKRPVNLDLTTLRYPPMAIASILHRISGVVLFLLFPLVLYLFSRSLHSQAEFLEVQQCVLCKWALWAFGAALVYHVLAGVRHLLMDMGLGEGLQNGRRSALAVFVLAIVFMILLGIWLW